MVVKLEGESNTLELINLLKVENQALKEELAIQRSRVKDCQFDNAQLRHKSKQIDQLYDRIETMQGTESEMSALLKRLADSELKLIHQQGNTELALRDKR